MNEEFELLRVYYPSGGGFEVLARLHFLGVVEGIFCIMIEAAIGDKPIIACDPRAVIVGPDGCWRYNGREYSEHHALNSGFKDWFIENPNWPPKTLVGPLSPWVRS